MKKGIIVLLVVLLTGVLMAEGFAQPFRGRIDRRPMSNRDVGGFLWILRQNQEELNITDEQMNKIKGLMDEFEKSMLKMRQTNQTLQLELRQLIREENRDYALLRKTMEKISSGRHDMVIAGMKLRDEMINILTPEQKEKLKEMRQDRMLGSRGMFRRDMGFRRFPHRLNRFRR
ncbi:MAG: Spy/CpxP family protein refolding chaperone [Candidatus Aminicenantes bacterium]|nr:Spy/CpxP family protein refolding chaperone [Candidatus Aminicenantes bacterium]